MSDITRIKNTKYDTSSVDYMYITAIKHGIHIKTVQCTAI